MKLFFILSFILTFAKAGLWIGIGTLISKHFDTLVFFLVRKPIPEGLIESKRLESAKTVIKWIGIFIILVGVGVAITGIASLMASFYTPTVTIDPEF